jgi:DNA polymerase III subunit alpha
MSENTGHGSSGSWRDDKVDSTHAWKSNGKAKVEKDKYGIEKGLESQLGFHGEVLEPGGSGHRAGVGVRRAKNGSRHPMRWVSLHHHSTFSYGDGFQLPEAHVRRAAELNMPAIALTEHGNVSSHIKLEGAAQRQGIKPIFGVELYTGEIDEEHRTQSKNHLTILAENQVGYGNLLDLVTTSWDKGFYHEPTIDGQLLYDHRDGLLVLSGCQGSLLATSLVGGKLIAPKYASYGRGLRVAERFSKAFPDSYYLEVQAFPELEQTRKINVMIERIARRLHLPLVASMDVHYTAPDEAEIQKILHNVRPGEKRTLEDMERAWGYEAPLCPVLTDRVLYRRLRATGLSHRASIQAIHNAAEIAERCNVVLPRLPELQYPLPPGYRTPRDLWRDWLLDGWRFRRCDELSPAERQRYKARLKREMDLIESKGYENYFLVVSDAVKWAKDNDVPVGPARGSAAASLAAWLLRITEVNPMVHDKLVFERFIDENRKDMPDIDLDFDAQTRWRLREYLLGKYGACYNIGTFTYYRAKNSLDDVARAHKVPKWEVEVIKNQLIERSSGDLRSSATIEDTIAQFDESRDVVERYPELRRATDLEGNIKGFGVHAAGLVLGQVRSVAPIFKRTIKGREVEVVAIDKWDSERQGLLKMDFLGLNTMSLVATALRDIGMELQDMYDLPLDDPNVIKVFQDNDVVGIFQFEGRAVRLVNGQVKPDNFDEICDVTSLARPGPLHNGAAEAYMNIKNGNALPEARHPAIDRIVGATKFQIIYQEQILRIVREIGDFDWTAAAYIRKIISKKLGDQEFNRQKDKFMQGALTIHKRSNDPDMPEEMANWLWGSCITSGSYAFNFAHACAYGMLSYWCAWLKTYHDAAFYTAALACMSDDRRNTLIRDAMTREKFGKENIDVRPPSVKRSGRTWNRTGRKVRMGFEQLPGIGETMANRVIETRDTLGLKTWDSLINVSGIGPAKLGKITDFIAHEDPFGVFDVDRRIEEARKHLWRGRLRQPTHRSIDIPYEGSYQFAAIWMGVVRKKNLRDMFEVNARQGRTLDPNKMRNPELREFMLLIGEDEHDILQLRVDRFHYPKMKEACWGIKEDTDIVYVEGFKRAKRVAREIVVTRLVVIELDDDFDEQIDDHTLMIDGAER